MFIIYDLSPFLVYRLQEDRDFCFVHCYFPNIYSSFWSIIGAQ